MINKYLIKGLNFRKTDLFKTSFWNGLATIIKMATGLISNKIVAVYLGPSGVALLGQFTNFTGIAGGIAGMGLSRGITKYIAEYSTDEIKRKKILSTGLKTLLLGTFVTSIIISIGADFFCKNIFNDKKYVSLFYVFSLTLLLFALNGFILAVLNGYKEFKKIISINIISSFIGMITSIILVINYGIFGALLGTILSVSLVVFVTFFFVARTKSFKIVNFTAKFDLPAFRNLSKYTLMAFTSMFAVTYIQLMIRTYIINHLSIVDAGYWQGVNKISDIYLSIITTTLSIYYLPRLSEINNNNDLKIEIFRGYKFLLPLTIISSLIIFIFRNFIIDTLYSPAFRPMEQLFLFQLIGNVFQVCSLLISFLMVAKAMTKTYIITELVFGLGFYVLTIIFLDKYGTIGVTYAYCLNFLLYLIIVSFIFRKLFLPRHKY